MQWCTVAGTMAELELNSSSYIRSESFTNGESPLLNDTAVDLDEEDVSLDSLNRRILDSVNHVDNSMSAFVHVHVHGSRPQSVSCFSNCPC